MPHIRRHSKYQASAASQSVSPALHSQLATPIAPSALNQQPAITNLAVVPGTLDNDSAVISWNVVPGAQGRLEYGTDPSLAVGSLLTAKELGYLTFHQQGIPGANPLLLPGTTYYYRVVEALTQAGMLGQSAIQNFLTTGGAPASVYGPRATPATPSGPNVFTMSGISDVTGTTDMRAQVQAYINSVGSGTALAPRTIIIPAGWILLFTGNGIDLSGMSYLTFWGYGATIRNFGTGNNISSSAFRCNNTHDVKILGMTMRGANPYVRTYQQYNNPGGESSEGVHCVNGSHHIEVADNRIYDQWGHAFYEAYQGAMPHDLWVHHNYVDGMGVMGLVVGGGTDLTYEWNDIIDTAISPIDVEDAATGQVIRRVHINDNRISRWSWDPYYDNSCLGQFTNLSLGNRPTVDGLYFERNLILNGPIVGGNSWSDGLPEKMNEGGTFAQPTMSNGYGHSISVGLLNYGAGYITEVYIRDNVIYDIPPGVGAAPVNNTYVRAGPFIFLGYCVGGAVTGNVIHRGVAGGSAVQLLSCSGVTNSGNTVGV